MENLILVVENMGRFLAALGGSLATIFMIYGGIQWMTAVGDPQRVAEARGSIYGVAIGLMILGFSFIIPNVLARTIIAPVGGVAVVSGESSTDCDALLRQQFVFQVHASIPERFNRLIADVQTVHKMCRPDVWNPQVLDDADAAIDDTANLCVSMEPPYTGFLHREEVQIQGVRLPRSMVAVTAGTPPGYLPHPRSYRDSLNNVQVLWDPDAPPSDRTVCWIYLSHVDNWYFAYR